MSWSSWAKSIAKEAQRGIDKVLEIQEDGSENPKSDGAPSSGGGEPARSDPENDPENLAPVKSPPRKKSIEIGSQEKTGQNRSTPVNGNDGWNDNQWDAGWDNDSKNPDPKKSKPLKLTKSPRKTPPKKSPPKSRMKATKILNESENLTNGSVEAPPKLPTEKPEIIPEPLPVPVKEPEPDKSPEPVLPKIEPKIAKDTKNNAEISHLTEHADSLANSFQLTMQQLHQREQQLIQCSTNNATLLAENDELKSQNEFLTQFQEQAKSVSSLNSKIELTLKNKIKNFDVIVIF